MANVIVGQFTKPWRLATPDTDELAVEVDRFLTEMIEMGGLEAVSPGTAAAVSEPK